MNSSQSCGVPSGRNWEAKTREEAGVLVAPPHPGQIQVEGRLVALGLVAGPDLPSPGVGPGEDQPADPLGAARGVGHRHRTALRDPEQREPVEPDGLDHGFQVVDPVVEGEARAPSQSDRPHPRSS